MTIIGYIILAIVSSIFLYSLYDVNNKIVAIMYFLIPFSGLSLYNNVEISLYILPFTLCAVLWIILQLIKPVISSNNISLDTNNSFIIFSLIFLRVFHYHHFHQFLLMALIFIMALMRTVQEFFQFNRVRFMFFN